MPRGFFLLPWLLWLALSTVACGGDESGTSDDTAVHAEVDAVSPDGAGDADVAGDAPDGADVVDSADGSADTEPGDAPDSPDGGDGDPPDQAQPPSMLCQVAAEDTQGVAQLGGQTVTVQGIVMSDGGLLANKKLRTHLQDDSCGVALFADETVLAGVVEAIGPLVAGDELRVTGTVSQLGTNDESQGAFDGLTRVVIDDVDGVERVAQGLALPEPVLLDLPQILAAGDSFEGLLVKVEGLTKASVDAATWVSPADKGTYVDVVDGAGAGPIKLRLSNGKNTGGYGADPGAQPFGVIGFLREDLTVTPETAGAAPVGFEIWPRGAADILP